MKKSKINVMVICQGVSYICRTDKGIPVALDDEMKLKMRDIVAKHIHGIATDIQKEITSSDAQLVIDMYPLHLN